MNEVNVSRVAARTDSFVPMMSRPSGLVAVEEILVDAADEVARRVVVHVHLLDDDALLALDLLGVEPRVAQHVDEHVERDVARTRGALDVVARVLLAGERVELAADPVDLRRDVARRRPALGSLEEHVLGEVGDAADLRRLVAGACREHDEAGDGLRLRHRCGEHADAVGELGAFEDGHGAMVDTAGRPTWDHGARCGPSSTPCRPGCSCCSSWAASWGSSCSVPLAGASLRPGDARGIRRGGLVADARRRRVALRFAPRVRRRDRVPGVQRRRATTSRPRPTASPRSSGTARSFDGRGGEEVRAAIGDYVRAVVERGMQLMREGKESPAAWARHGRVFEAMQAVPRRPASPRSRSTTIRCDV